MQATSARPRFTRAALSALVVVIALATSACLSPNQVSVQDELNKDRVEHSVRALPIQQEAQAKAQKWAEKLARENRLYHSNLPDGIHVKWCSIGENVG
ncbi:MAG: hypothetical protein U0P45_15190 [Acidimicrobiales bacterium]